MILPTLAISVLVCSQAEGTGGYGALSRSSPDSEDLNGANLAVIASIKPEIKALFSRSLDYENVGRRRLQYVGFDGDRECLTPILEWALHETSKVPSSTFSFFLNYQIDMLPFLAKALFDDNEEDEFLGANGEFTEELNTRHSQLETFWKHPNAMTESVLLGAHGTILQDTEKLLQVVEVVYDADEGFSHRDIAQLIQTFVESMPGNYSNPLLTANAIALSSEAASRLGIDAVDAVVIGDGILEAIGSLGYGMDGPDFILAHEYGHVLHYELGSHKPWYGYSASENRRLEMLCDAMAAYFMAHPQGGARSIEYVDQLHGTASLLGDYRFTSENHHGTPAQRECSVLWGANVGHNGTDLVPLTTFIDVFDEHHERLLNTNDTICPTVVDRPECGSGATSVMVVLLSVAISVLSLLALML